MSQWKIKESLPEVVVFIGFRHKRQGLEAAKKQGLKTVLMTRNNAQEAHGLFDEIIEGDIASTAFMDEAAKFLKKKYRIKGVISNYEHYVMLRAYLAQKLDVPTAPLASVACSRNKALQRQTLGDLPFNIDFQLASTLQEAEAAFEALGRDVFLKSIAGIKSRMVFHVKTPAELKKNFTQLQSIDPDAQENLYHKYADYSDLDYPDPTQVFLVEKAEYGQQVTVSSFVESSGVWHAPSLVDVYPASHLGRPDSFLAFRILPSRFESKLVTRVMRATQEAAMKIELKHCPLFSEFIVKKNGEVKLIELASRMGGYRPLMYQKAYDLDLTPLMIQNAMGHPINSNAGLPVKKYVSLIEIFPESEGILEKIESLESLKNHSQVSNLTVLHKKGDKVGLAKNGFEPCLSFLVEGEDYEAVYQLSMHYSQRLKVVTKGN